MPPGAVHPDRDGSALGTGFRADALGRHDNAAIAP